MDNKNSRPILIWIIVILAVLLIAVLVKQGTNKNVEKESKTNSMSQESNNPAATPDYMKPQIPTTLTDDQKTELKAGSADHQATNLTFNVSGGSFFFTPNEIRVKQGDKVKIIFTNVGGTHNFILPDFNVESKTIQTGEADTLEFVADKKGVFEFYCGVGKGYHRQMGQIGVFLVE